MVLPEELARAPVVHDEAAGMVFHEKRHVGDEVHQVADGAISPIRARNCLWNCSGVMRLLYKHPVRFYKNCRDKSDTVLLSERNDYEAC